ncbi:hypothetical protein SprV_0200679300 [Sparganum proliferum]
MESYQRHFAVANRVKQGCVLTPTLFNLMFSVILMDTYCDERPGIRVAYRTDGQLFNQRRMHFQSRDSTINGDELPFADDCALNAAFDGDMQRSMDLFAAARDNVGLIINTEKTVVMRPPPRYAAYVAPQNNVNGAQLQVVNNFTYLGSTLFSMTKIDDQVARRIPKPAKPSAPEKHRLEPSRSPSQHQTEYVQGSHPAEADVRGRDLDGKCSESSISLPVPTPRSQPLSEPVSYLVAEGGKWFPR